MLVNCLSVADGKGPGNAGSLIFWITVKCSLAFCIQRPLNFEWNTFPWVHLVISYRTLSKWLILTVPILITPSNIKLDSLKPYSRRWGVRNERNNFNEQQWLICFLGLHNVVSNCWCKLFFVPFQIFSMYPLWVARGFWIGKREDRCRCFAIWPNEPEMTRRCAGSVDFFYRMAWRLSSSPFTFAYIQFDLNRNCQDCVSSEETWNLWHQSTHLESLIPSWAVQL